MPHDGPSYKSAILGLSHINLNVPTGSLHLAEEFYGTVLGLTSVPVPEPERMWFQMPTGQQIHVSYADDADIAAQPTSPRHICFQLPSVESLIELQQRVNDHYASASKAAAMEVDKVGEPDSGAQGFEGYPTRFFARDYAGNRLEFSL